jgi:hypothetical protein
VHHFDMFFLASSVMCMMIQVKRYLVTWHPPRDRHNTFLLEMWNGSFHSSGGKAFLSLGLWKFFKLKMVFELTPEAKTLFQKALCLQHQEDCDSLKKKSSYFLKTLILICNCSSENF